MEGGIRALKSQARHILSEPDRQEAVCRILSFRPRKVINALISLFCDRDDLVRWRAVSVSGEVAAALAQSDKESARVVMRRLMWMLNDESGGIGWGAPEAMGEITASSPAMAGEYSQILCSYVFPERNFLEHPGLQRGLLWGLGRLARTFPLSVKEALPHILVFTESEDPVHRGHAAWTAGNLGDPAGLETLQGLFSDRAELDFFDHWHLTRVRVKDLARDAAERISG